MLAGAMRLKRSLQNAFVGVFGQIFSIVCNFATRMVFVRVLSQEYLGIEGLFSSLLLLLSLAELGIGSAIIFSLYEPLAKDDQPKIRALMRLYRIAYWTIAGVVSVLGLALSFKLEWFIRDMPDIPHLQTYFLIFVANTAVSYLFSYKASLIQADQKQYVVNLWQYFFTFVMCATQIILLLTTGSYLAFLLTMLVSTAVQNICIAVVADRMYPFIKGRGDVAPVDPETMDQIKKNTFALVLHKIAGIASTPATNMILSAFVGLRVVAIYANYLLVTLALQRLVNKVFDAAVASIGNLGVTESRERQREVFDLALYVNALLGTLVSVPLLAVFTTTMTVFFGADYVFAGAIEFAIVALFFLKMIRTTALSFTSAFGLYWFTRWKAVVETVVLIGLSLLAAPTFGIGGILVANCVTSFFVSGLIEGYMLFKHGLGVSSRRYFVRVTGYCALVFALGALTYLALSPIGHETIGDLLIRGVISLVVATIGFFGATMRTGEFKQFMELTKNVRGLLRRSA